MVCSLQIYIQFYAMHFFAHSSNIASFANIKAKEAFVMRNRKYYIALNESERNLIVKSLNDLRNNLIEQGKYTDGVDELLIKIINAKQKYFKVI